MRSFVRSLAILVALAGLAVAASEKKFGKELTLKEATKISAIYADPDAFQGKRVQVEGAIVDVCPKRGCWMKIAGDKEHQTLLFKVQDGIMVFPVELRGMQARVEGTVSVRPLTEEEAAAKAKGEKGCASGCCNAAVMLKGEGAVVAEAPVAR